MKFRTKILADRWLGAPLAVALSFFVRILGLLLRPDHSPPVSPRVIVIAKYEGMGSILYSGVLCAAFKRKFPNARIVYLSRESNVELLKRIPGIDEILSLDDRSLFRCLRSSLSIVVRMRRLKPDLFFDMEVYSSFAAILATFSLARNRYGFYRKAATFKKGLHTHSIFFNASRHVTEAYRQFALAAGLTEEECPPVSLRVLPEDRSECAAALDRLGIDPGARLLLVNPNASDLLMERRWPLEKWAALLETLPPERDLSVLIVGAKSERDYAERLLNLLSEPARRRVRDVAGEFTLGGFFALIERAALMATSDTGPLHFALALDCPTVSLWGPGSPSHYGPLDASRHRVIYQPVYCSPCLYHADVTPCGGDNICMKRIEVETVSSALSEILAQGREPSRPAGVAPSASRQPASIIDGVEGERL